MGCEGCASTAAHTPDAGPQHPSDAGSRCSKCSSQRAFHGYQPQSATQIHPRRPAGTDTANGPAAKRHKTATNATAATSSNGGAQEASQSLGQQQNDEGAVGADGSKDRSQGVLLQRVGEPEAAGQQLQQEELRTTALSRADAANAMACLDTMGPGSVSSVAQLRAYLALSAASNHAERIPLTGPGYTMSQGPILFGGFTKLMDMAHTENTAGPLCECAFEPDETWRAGDVVTQLLDDVPAGQLRTLRGLRKSVSKTTVLLPKDTNEGEGLLELKTGLVQVAVDAYREGLGLRGFFRGALPLLRKAAAEPITAAAGSRAKAADVIRSHVYSVVHVARILATIYNMLLPNK